MPMKKVHGVLSLGLGLILTLAIATPAFAAYNDVTLTTDAVINVGGASLNVAGSSNVVESITVGATDFSFTLSSGSTIKVSSPTFKRLNTNAAAEFRAGRVCESTESSITHSSSNATAATVTITVSSLNCPEGSGSGGSNAGNSGGGGGGGATVVSTVTPVVTVQTTNAAAIAAIKTQLIALIQQLIILLTQELQAMQASGNY